MDVTEFYPPTILNLAVSVIMFFGYINIVLATVINKHLQNPCNLLIAFSALTEFSLLISWPISAYYLFSGKIYTNRLECYYAQIFCVASAFASIFSTFTIGVDRMIAVVAPFRYHHLKHFYALVMVSLSVLFGISLAYVNYLFTLSTPNDTVACFTPSMVHPNFMVAKNISFGVVCGLIWGVYAIAWAGLLFKTKKSTHLFQLLKSVTIIMSIEVLAWPVGLLLNVLARQFIQSEKALLIILYSNMIQNSFKAMTYFILFKFSKDYGRAFSKQLEWIPYFGKVFKPKTASIMVIGVKQNPGS